MIDIVARVLPDVDEAGKVIRLFYTEKSNPTSDDIDAFVRSQEYTESEFGRISVVVKATNKVWRYYDNEKKWVESGSDVVQPFNQNILGTIKGNEEDGYVFHREGDEEGLGQVKGWDEIKTRKLDKNTNVTPYPQAYVKNADGTQGLLNITSSGVNAGDIVAYDDSKCVQTGTPSHDNQATPKSYVDNLIKDKQDKLPEVVRDRYLHTNEETGALEWSEVKGGTGGFVAPDLASKYYVNATSGIDKDEEGWGESEDKPFKTIQYAYDFVLKHGIIGSGNTNIYLAPGTYTATGGSFRFGRGINKGGVICIRGTSGQKENTILEGIMQLEDTYLLMRDLTFKSQMVVFLYRTCSYYINVDFIGTSTNRDFFNAYYNGNLILEGCSFSGVCKSLFALNDKGKVNLEANFTIKYPSTISQSVINMSSNANFNVGAYKFITEQAVSINNAYNLIQGSKIVAPTCSTLEDIIPGATNLGICDDSSSIILSTGLVTSLGMMKNSLATKQDKLGVNPELTTKVLESLTIDGLSYRIKNNASWGNITGELKDQTDLQTALDNKQDKINTTQTLIFTLEDDTEVTIQVYTKEA